MNRKSLCIVLSLSLGLLAGCATQTASTSVRNTASTPVKNEETPAVVLLKKVESIPEPTQIVELSKEAKAVTDQFIKQGVGNTEYALTDTTGFPESLLSLQPGRPKPKFIAPNNYSGVPTRGLTADGYTVDLVDRDWTGIILTPVLAQVAKAYVSGIQLSNIEVHPLTDGRVRIWVRLRNQVATTIPTEIACAFKRDGQGDAVTMFYHLSIPSNSSRDVFFISPGGNDISYTVLVRRSPKTAQR